MKALVKQKPEPGLWLTDVEKPKPGHNDVLIKIIKTSICGTDLHIYNWDEWAQQTVPTLLTIGHEFVGEIVELGQDVTRLNIGDRVSGENHVACAFCRCCRSGRAHLCRINESVGVTSNGCFAEYLVLPAANTVRIPDDISDNEAAILNPLGNSTHCALSFNVVGEDVLITGAGPVGIMAAKIVRHIGARHVVITDVNEFRLEMARKMGATLAINPKKTSLSEVMNQLGMREGFDIGLEMSGNPQAFTDMLAHMNNGGKVTLLGFLPNSTTINWNDVILKGLEIKGIYGREMYETWYKMICMLESGLDISPIITHELSYKDYQKAFDLIASGNTGKIILNW